MLGLARVKMMGKQNLVEIYTTDWCGFCNRAMNLLKSHNIKYTQYDLTLNREGRKAMSLRAGGKTSVPQIFINDIHIGGSDELIKIALNGSLDNLLNS